MDRLFVDLLDEGSESNGALRCSDVGQIGGWGLRLIDTARVATN